MTRFDKDSFMSRKPEFNSTNIRLHVRRKSEIFIFIWKELVKKRGSPARHRSFLKARQRQSAGEGFATGTKPFT